ncbi:nuclear transport factor 2 family protein [Streptomyces stackebrandtii]|uniref:nuclear transport factor 2 family protein n=1 Tax=Streptomyces stackebrandtii TaxID=3051177 RepID=UPI0028DC09E1|nr:nuclear transport factor 2 family protein [Streptomyces sp. DSM 40976]
MSIPPAIADRFEIEALRGEIGDAVMMRDYDRVASLFTSDGVMRWPHIGKEFTGRAEIRAGVEWGQGLWEFFVQNAHPGTIRLDGDLAAGRAYVQEFGRMRDGSSHANHAVYHDRYQRTADGWKFTERVYEVRYLDSTPLAGSPLPYGPLLPSE